MHVEIEIFGIEYSRLRDFIMFGNDYEYEDWDKYRGQLYDVKNWIKLFQ